jgi:hypothetical protein
MDGLVYLPTCNTTLHLSAKLQLPKADYGTNPELKAWGNLKKFFLSYQPTKSDLAISIRSRFNQLSNRSAD